MSLEELAMVDDDLNKASLEEYILAEAQRKVSRTNETEAFLKGFRSVIGPNIWWSANLLSEADLQQLVGVAKLDDQQLQQLQESATMLNDMSSAEEATRMIGSKPDSPFSPAADVHKWFWEMMWSMSPSERSDVLIYATGGTASAPPGGFQENSLRLIVTRAGPTTEATDPSDKELSENCLNWHFRAATCFNQLRIPRFVCAEQMRPAWDRSLRFQKLGAQMTENMLLRRA